MVSQDGEDVTRGILRLGRVQIDPASTSLIFDAPIGRHDGFCHLPNAGKEPVDPFTAPPKIGERCYAEIAEQQPIAVIKAVLHPRRRIVVEHLLAPAVGGDDPEHGLPSIEIGRAISLMSEAKKKGVLTTALAASNASVSAAR